MLTGAFGPLFLRPSLLGNKCDENIGHYHNYDHVTFVDRGSIEVYIKKYESEPEKLLGSFQAGNPNNNKVLIKAGLIHRIKALEPNTIYTCVFTHIDFDSDSVVQQYNANPRAYT